MSPAGWRSWGWQGTGVCQGGLPHCDSRTPGRTQATKKNATTHAANVQDSGWRTDSSSTIALWQPPGEAPAGHDSLQAARRHSGPADAPQEFDHAHGKLLFTEGRTPQGVMGSPLRWVGRMRGGWAPHKLALHPELARLVPERAVPPEGVAVPPPGRRLHPPTPKGSSSAGASGWAGSTGTELLAGRLAPQAAP